MANTTSYAATKYSNLSKARLHITYVNSKPASLDCEWKNGGRSHGDGTGRKLVGQFPSSVAIYIFLTTEICGNFLKYCCPTGNIRETFLVLGKGGFPPPCVCPGNPRFPETRLAIGQNHHNLKSRAWAVWSMESLVCVTISTKESLISRCISDVNEAK